MLFIHFSHSPWDVCFDLANRSICSLHFFGKIFWDLRVRRNQMINVCILLSGTGQCVKLYIEVLVQYRNEIMNTVKEVG